MGLSLVEWALKHSRELNLKVEKITSTSEYLDSTHDFNVSITYQGQQKIGRGIDLDEQTALTKAISEALERCIVNSSNGVAAHVDQESAQKNSRYELLERDLFLLHYYARIPMVELDQKKTLSFLTSKGLNFLNYGKITIKSYSTLPTESGLRTVLTVASQNDRKFGLICGLSLKDSIDSAIYKSLTEVMMNVIHFTREPIIPLSSQQLLFEKIATPRSHLLWGLHPESYNSIYPWIGYSRPENGVTQVKSHTNENQYSLKFSPKTSADPPLFVVKCSNKNLINLEFGVHEFTRENLIRLSEVADKNFELSNINRFPHPIG